MIASSTNSAIVRVVLPSWPSTGSQAKAINSKGVTGANFGGEPDRGLSRSPFTPWRRNRSRQRHAETIARLEAVRDIAGRFGGSHAQRDALTLTLIEAAIRSGRLALARHYTAERTVHKPASGWGWRLLARTNAVPG